jgi:hypothetical protein
MAGAVQGLIGSLERTAPTPSFSGTLNANILTGTTYDIVNSGSNFTSATVTSGAIPTGMTFTASANSFVSVSGQATTAGTYNFTVTAVNNPGGELVQASVGFSYTITATTAANKRCTSFQISIGCCTNTLSCGPLGAGVTCSPASGSFDVNAC